MDMDSDDDSWDWTFPGSVVKYPDLPDSDPKPAVHVPRYVTDTAALGLMGVYKGGVMIVPDGYTSPVERKPVLCNGIPAGPNPTFDVMKYQKFRTLINQRDESQFYQNVLNGLPVLTKEDLTPGKVLEEFISFYGPVDTESPSLQLYLAEYKRARGEELDRWQKSMQDAGNSIFDPLYYPSDDMAPKRPKVMNSIILATFTPAEIDSFDMNPVTNPTGRNWFRIDRPKVDIGNLHVLEPRKAGASAKSEPREHFVFNETTHDLVLARELKSVGIQLDWRLIHGQLPPALGVRAQEFLKQYPLGLQYEEFLKRLPSYLGYFPQVEAFGYTDLWDLVRTEPDLFHVRYEEDSEENPITSTIILSPSDIGPLMGTTDLVLSRVWHKLCCMIALTSMPIPVTQVWRRFQNFISSVEDVVGPSIEPRTAYYSGLGYTSWGFKTVTDFIKYCQGKWKKERFYLLQAGAEVKGMSTVEEESVFIAKTSNPDAVKQDKAAEEAAVAGASYRRQREKPLKISSKVPIGFTRSRKKLKFLSDGLKIGDKLKCTAGDLHHVRLFGMIPNEAWYAFRGFLELMKRYYERLATLDEEYQSVHRVTKDRLKFNGLIIVCLNQEWSRAVVINLLGKDEYLVYLIDYGGFWKAHISRMRYFKNEFLSFPAVGILCRFASTDQTEMHYRESRVWDHVASFRHHMVQSEHGLEIIGKAEFCKQTIWDVLPLSIDRNSTTNEILLDNIDQRILLPPTFSYKNIRERLDVTPNNGGMTLLTKGTERKHLRADQVLLLKESDSDCEENLVKAINKD